MDLIARNSDFVACGTRGFRNLRQGGGDPGQSDKKKLLQRFFFFLVFSLFYRSQMVNYKEIYHFQGSRGGSNIFQGVQLFPGGGGSNCLFPIETHLTCDFPGAVRTPCPPLWIRNCAKNKGLNQSDFQECFTLSR